MTTREKLEQSRRARFERSMRLGPWKFVLLYGVLAGGGSMSIITLLLLMNGTRPGALKWIPIVICLFLVAGQSSACSSGKIWRATMQKSRRPRWTFFPITRRKRDKLKKEQLAWINRRNAAGQPAKGNAEGNPTDAADGEVIKMTLARAAELEKRLKKAK